MAKEMLWWATLTMNKGKETRTREGFIARLTTQGSTTSIRNVSTGEWEWLSEVRVEFFTNHLLLSCIHVVQGREYHQLIELEPYTDQGVTP